MEDEKKVVPDTNAEAAPKDPGVDPKSSSGSNQPDWSERARANKKDRFSGIHPKFRGL